MKRILILLFFVLIQFEISSQIPNGGFEEWEVIQNYENPLYWNTNQNPNYHRFEKDTMAIEGEYALKVIQGAFSGWHDCISYAWTGVNLQDPIGEHKSLTFFAKSIPYPYNTSGKVYLKVNIKLFIANQFYSNKKWETFEKIESLTKIQIPIQNPDIDSMVIEIFGGALNGAADGCIYESISCIDGMKIEDTSNSGIQHDIQNHYMDVLLFPNPTNGHIHIKPINLLFNEFRLFNTDGRLIEEGYLQDSMIILKNDLKGWYIIQLISQSDYPYPVVSKRIYLY